MTHEQEITELQNKLREMMSAKQDTTVHVKVDINIPAFGDAGMKALKLILDTLGKIFK